MSLRPCAPGKVPAQTAKVARLAFPKGCLCMRIRDVLGPLFTDEDFADLYPRRGQPAWPPHQLALVLVLQFLEGLSDRQAAAAVRSRIDWKFLMGLRLDDPGFDYSVLSEFRSRLVKCGDDHILDLLLDRLRKAGLVKAEGHQRTDSTHVLAVLRMVNRLELVGETMRAALDALAAAAPEWLIRQCPPQWVERYGRRVEEYRLPKNDTERLVHAQRVGADGVLLLACIDAPTAPVWLREIPAIRGLRQIWQQQYRHDDEGQLHWRSNKELPASEERQASPYESDARYGIKRNMSWTGYKAHLTETCSPNSLHLIVNVATGTASAADSTMTAAVHNTLASRSLLPAVHVIDSGYTSGELLVVSQAEYGVELLGPTRQDSSWQTKAGHGFGMDGFHIDWDHRTVTCPRDKTSIHWSSWRQKNGEHAIHVEFATADCAACPVRGQCTRARREPRQLTLHERPVHEALQQARQAEKTEEWKARYTIRAGIEGTISQDVRSFGLRRCRYRGAAKTHLQHVCTAAAINLARTDAWLTGTPLSRTRVTRFTVLHT